MFANIHFRADRAFTAPLWLIVTAPSPLPYVIEFSPQWISPVQYGT